MPTVHMTRFDTVTQAYFPVSLQSVFVGDKTVSAADYQAVVRDDTGAVLGIHRKGYKLVPNREVFVPFEEAILSSGVALQGIKVQEGIAYSGRTVVREYIFPAVKVEPRVGDLMAFKLKVVNSYDATNAFRAYAAGHRLCCLNGMVREERGAIVYAWHTAGFSVEVAVDKIRQATERYLGCERRWAAWAGRAILPAAAVEVFAAMPETNPKRLVRLQSAWETESAAVGSTVWALYNALTHYADGLIMPHGCQVPRSSLAKERASFGIKLRPGLLVPVGPCGYFCSFIACSTRRSNVHENIQINQQRCRGHHI